jgi:nucleoside-diphosphate-sugar epimerase
MFLTGATGFVGGLLLRRLAEQNPNRFIFALARSARGLPCFPNTFWIKGDICEPKLGLAPDLYSKLCESIETIVHCAASTKFTVPLEDSRKVNVQGTRNILQLARRTRRLKLLLHVSTVYIAGRRSGPVRETEFTHPDGWFSPYEQSKFEAEKLIHENGRDIPWIIARLSTIVGNSLTGTISQFNYFHQLLRLIPGNRFPIIPGVPEAPVDVIADDWLTEAFEAILRRNPEPGRIFHLCAGPSQALPAQEILEMAFRVHHERQSGGRSHVPRFVSLGEFQEFARVLQRQEGTGLSRMAELLLLYLPHLHVRQSFLNQKTDRFLATMSVVRPPTREYLSRIIQSCL